MTDILSGEELISLLGGSAAGWVDMGLIVARCTPVDPQATEEIAVLQDQEQRGNQPWQRHNHSAKLKHGFPLLREPEGPAHTLAPHHPLNGTRLPET